MRRQEFAVVALATAFALAAPPAWAQRPGGTPAGTAEPRGGGGESGGGGGGSAVPRGGDSGGGSAGGSSGSSSSTSSSPSSSAPPSSYTPSAPSADPVSYAPQRRGGEGGNAAAGMAAAETAAALAAPFPEGRAEAEVRAGLHAAAPAVHRRPRARRPGRIRTAINVPSRPIAVLATAVSSSAKPSSGLVRSREPATAGMSSLATTTATTRTASGMAVTATVSGTSTIRSGARTALDTPAMAEGMDTEEAMATAEGMGTAEVRVRRPVLRWRRQRQLQP